LISNHFNESVGGPEKAGVGGSIPSLATNNFNNLASLKNRVKISRAHNTRTLIALDFTFGVARSSNFQISRALSLTLPMCWNANLAITSRTSNVSDGTSLPSYFPAELARFTSRRRV